MANKGLLIIADFTEETPLSLNELCESCQISIEFIQELAEYQIIHRRARNEEWRFDLNEVKRVRTALRLQRDLEVNLAGAAVVLDLLDELEGLRAEHVLLQKYVGKTE